MVLTTDPVPATPVGIPADSPAPRYYPVTSADGTVLQAWTNDAEGPTVLLCNGLGTNPYTWPALLDPECGIRVLSWNHRGVGGSERPAQRHRVDIHTFVEDAVAVLDDAAVDGCVAAGWSMGVNTSFQLAVDHPGRVTGLFAVGGVPGDTFGTMLGPVPMPRWARRAVSTNIARAIGMAGPLLSPIARRLPIGPVATSVLMHSGFMLPYGDRDETARAVREFLTTPLDWYMHMAVASSRHVRVSLSQLDVPASFVAGKYDVLAGSREMRTAAERMPDADYVELVASHFIPLEYSVEVLDLLKILVRRVQAAG